MSVYQYDVIRCEKDLAKKILTSTEIEPDTITRMDDGSIYLSWETWHGSPFPDFENLLDDNTPWLYAVENNDLEVWFEKSSCAPKHWEDEICVTDESVSFIKYGENISKEDI